MFGQTSNTFGSTNNTFGQSGGFGTSTAFGTATTQAGGFGAKTGTGFGGFGTTTPATGGGLFGATTPAASTAGGLFGNTNTNNTFGQQQQQQPATGFNFGASNTQSQAGTLFGANTNTQSNLFSTPTSNAAFGTKTPGFNTTSTGGGLFGNTAASTGTSLFGSTQTPSTGMFSGFSGGAAATVTGSTVKFNPPAGQDTMLKQGQSQNINTKHQCINAMKEYENKSMEEIRFEDYAANRKGPQAASTTGTGIFAASTQPAATTGFGTGLFSQPTQNKTGFGFGTQPAATSSGGLFGAATTQAQTGLFSNSGTKPLFGTATTTSAFGGFGATTTGTTSLFGATTQPKPGGLFGQTTTAQPAGLFGQTPQTSTAGGFGGFGTNTGFAQTQPSGGLFGAKPATGFGTATTNSGFTFGGNQASTGLFGQKAPASTGFSFNPGATNTAFGAQPAQTGGLFGKTGGFGTTNTLGGFGTTNTLGGGLNTGTGMFGQPNKPAGLATAFNTGANTLTLGGGLSGGLNTGLGTGYDPTAVRQAQLKQQLLMLANDPYGDLAIFKNLKQSDERKEELLKPTNPAAQKAALSQSTQYKVSPRPTAKIKPRPIHSIASGKAQLFEGLEEDEFSTFGNDTFQPRRSIKKLVIKTDHNRSMNRSQLLGSEDGTANNMAAPSPIVDTEKSSQKDGSEVSVASHGNINHKTPTQPVFTHAKSSPVLETTVAELNTRNRMRRALEESRLDLTGDEETLDQLSERSTTPPPHPAGIVLRRAGYYLIPALDELADCVDDNGDCFVENMVVGREGYGNVMFPGVLNVASMNIDDIVFFRRKEITIYPDDENKPDVGEGLNRPAQVTLDCVWSTDKNDHTPIKDVQRIAQIGYVERLERAAAKIGAKFLDYRPETGSWVFEVKHFSKYGLVEDSDDEDQIDPKKVKLNKEDQQKHLAVQAQKVALREKLAQQALQQKQTQLQRQMSEQTESQTDSESMSDDGQMSEAPATYTGLHRDMMLQGDSEMHDITRQQMPDMTEIDEISVTVDEQVPASHSLALSLGVRAEDLQIKKASFFGDEDEEQEPIPTLGRSPFLGRSGTTLGGGFAPGAFGSKSSPLAKPSPIPRTEKSVFNTSLRIQSPASQHSPFRSAFADPLKRGLPKGSPMGSNHIIVPSGMTDMPKARKIVGTRVTRCVPPLCHSVMSDKQRCISDMGLYQGRTFRTGWGPQWGLVHNGKPILQQDDEDNDEKEHNRFSLLPNVMGTPKRRLDATPFVLTLEKVHMAPHMVFDDPASLELLEKCLEVQLENSELTRDPQCPLFKPKIGVTALHAYKEQVRNSLPKMTSPEERAMTQQMCEVWDLCVALWGDVPLLTDEDDNNSYRYHMVRREQLSKWLSAVSSSKIQTEVERLKAKVGHDIGMVFSLLSGRQISEACREAQESGEHRLALLIAQASGAQFPRQLLQKQLADWNQCKADEFMDPERLKMYVLLAGHMTWSASHMPINVCHDLDWKRCLALHLWYKGAANSTIAEALREYDAAHCGRSAYAAPPAPAYIEQSGDLHHGIQDVSYHLLKLYSQRSHDMHVILNPSAATPNVLDHRLSWHLGEVLRALEYSHLSDYHHASLCCNYAAQLESLALWHWAVYVLLHIANTVQRELSVKQVLERHVELDRSEESVRREVFLHAKLSVPPQWIHQAKALRARTEARHDEEAWHLLKAAQWNTCHRVIIRHVASHAVINEHYDYLKHLLSELGASENCACIQDWNIGGKVFLDFINMMQTIEQLKQGEPSAYELEQLQPEVTSLANRISHLTCLTAADRLCQSEMAKRVANVMRTLLAMHHPQQNVSARLFAPTISQLPMPEDYALQELRQLTRNYIIEVTMS